MPRIVEHAPTILRATYSPGAIFDSFGESMKLAFIQIADHLSALAEYLCGIVGKSCLSRDVIFPP